MLCLQECVAAKHLRIVKVATEPNPAVMLTKALGRSKVEELCAEIGQTEPHAKTVDKKPKEVKKLKKVKFAVEATEIEPNNAKFKNEPKNATFAKAKNESTGAKSRWMHTMDCIQQNGREWRRDKLWNQKGSLNFPMWSCLELRSSSEGSESRAYGVATSTSLVERRVF